MTEEKLKTTIWVSHPDGDQANVWDVENPEEGKRFFQYLLDNYEFEPELKETIEVKQITQAEWEECVRVGNEMA